MANDDRQSPLPLGYTDEAYPEVYNVSAMPQQPKDADRKPGQLPEKTIRQFFEKGYILVDDFFKKEELDSCRDAIDKLVDELAKTLYKGGKIKNLYSEYGFFERLSKLEEEFPGANIILHKEGRLPQALRDLWCNERLLNVVEQLIGPDIGGHPVWNLRTKTPQNEATTVPWHQDNGYLDDDAYQMLIPTAWIPLLDANETNGCLQFAEEGHKTGRVATHQCCYGGTWYIMLEEDEIEKTLEVDLSKKLKTIPVKYGGMILFSNMIPHRSLANLSDKVRWSLDLRWQNPSKPVGFFGLKEAVVMRSSTDPNIKVDWESFDAVDRHEKGREYTSQQIEDVPKEEEFDTTIPGPWMTRWKITHVNRHVEKHREDEASQAKQPRIIKA